MIRTSALKAQVIVCRKLCTPPAATGGARPASGDRATRATWATSRPACHINEKEILATVDLVVAAVKYWDLRDLVIGVLDDNMCSVAYFNNHMEGL